MDGLTTAGGRDRLNDVADYIRSFGAYIRPADRQSAVCKTALRLASAFVRGRWGFASPTPYSYARGLVSSPRTNGDQVGQRGVSGG